MGWRTAFSDVCFESRDIQDVPLINVLLRKQDYVDKHFATTYCCPKIKDACTQTGVHFTVWALEELRRRIRAHRIGTLLLVCEDIPFVCFNMYVLWASNDLRPNKAVFVSIIISAVAIGAKSMGISKLRTDSAFEVVLAHKCSRLWQATKCLVVRRLEDDAKSQHTLTDLLTRSLYIRRSQRRLSIDLGGEDADRDKKSVKSSHPWGVRFWDSDAVPSFPRLPSLRRITSFGRSKKSPDTSNLSCG
jgi:hypothetical protein